MVETVKDMLMAAWFAGGAPLAAQVPPPEIPPPLKFKLPAPDEEPVVKFPIIEAAAKAMADKTVLTPVDYYNLDRNAKIKAFTISQVSSLTTMEKLRDALAKDVLDGGTLADFAGVVETALGESALSPQRIETIYRTNVASVYSEGQRAVLAHPLVKSEFPYVAYHAVHDSRARPEHKAMESHGIQGTNIYAADDPTILKFWPPWGFGCRCHVVAITLEDAAAAGIREAIQWVETGIAPAVRIHVKPPPFDLPPGWANAA